jgi:Fur family transcriptional regulator, ferric uptake regulator
MSAMPAARRSKLPDALRDTVRGRLRQANQRLTPNREALLEVLARNGSGPLTIPEIREVRPDLALSSIYRNLVVLEQADVVHRVVTRGDFAYYELVEELTEHHHHVVCSSCGAVEDVPASPTIERSLKDVARQIARRTGFKTQQHRLDLFGLCQRCA